jgi:hypothetical protein
MAGDASWFGGLFTDDGVEITPGMPPTQGPEAVTKEFASILAAQKNLKLNVGDVRVTIADSTHRHAM